MMEAVPEGGLVVGRGTPRCMRRANALRSRATEEKSIVCRTCVRASTKYRYCAFY